MDTILSKNRKFIEKYSMAINSKRVSNSLCFRRSFTLFLQSIILASFCMAQNFTQIDTGIVVNDGGHSIGSSWSDADNDGDLDLYVTNGILNGFESNFYYENLGNGHFLKLDENIIVQDSVFSESSSWGDYDNDGKVDLFLANSFWGAGSAYDFIFQNNGNHNFDQIVEGGIVNTQANSRSCAWGDYDNDGFIDLFIANESGPNFLYKNDRNGNLVSVRAGELTSENHESAGCAWADYDLDGDIDLFVANMGNQNNDFYRNEGEGKFTKLMTVEIVNDGGNSIGCSWGDYDNDGYPDLFVANFNNNNNFLYRNNMNGTFTKIIQGDIVNDSGNSFGSSWGDYNNDGFLDLFVANLDNQNNFLYNNNGDGTFIKISTGDVVNSGGSSEGTTWADYDNDGDLDLFVVNFEGENNFLFNNDGNENHWINITFNGIRSNRSAIGTKVSIKTGDGWQYREISGQTGYQSQNSLNVEFGLGSATILDTIIVSWPSGIHQILTDISVDQFLEVEESLPDHDLLLFPTESIPDEGASYANMTPEVLLLNGGKETVTQIMVHCNIESSSELIFMDSVMVDSLSTLIEKPILFESFQISSPEVYQIIYYIDYDLDENRQNDTVFHHLEISESLDGFEKGLNNWDIHGDWDVGLPAFSGENSLDNSPDGNYKNNSDQWAKYHFSFDLSQIQAAHLSFWTGYVIESGKDSGFVEVSHDGGVNWQQIGSSYTGTSSNWEQKFVNLANVAGEGMDNVQIRFHFKSDSTITKAGWWIDDVILSPEDPPVGINRNDHLQAKQIKLLDNFPNPFNTETSIQYFIPEQMDVSISIYNLKGNEIYTLGQETRSSGNHSITWNGQNKSGIPVSSGIYLYRVRIGGYQKIKKMTLLK